MTMQTYNLMKLKAQEMIRFFDVSYEEKAQNNTVNYIFDFTNQNLKNSIVELEDEYNECALTYQIRNYLEKKNGVDFNMDKKEMLRKKILYVDFSSVSFSKQGKKSVANVLCKKEGELEIFPESGNIVSETLSVFSTYLDGTALSKVKGTFAGNVFRAQSKELLKQGETYSVSYDTIKSCYTKDELHLLSEDMRLRFLFKNGFSIIYKKDKEGKPVEKITYMPFDKSASMARSSQMTFIDSKIKDDIDKRLMLGLEFGNVQTNLSKLYAYRGLYLSAARRVELKDSLKLNAETVIVIKDKHEEISEQSVISAQETETDSNSWKITTETKKTIDINCFDGEGFISRDYAKIINNYFKQDEKTSSFQIRMPFTKGILHSVDFLQFVSEFVDKNEKNERIIKDVFGRERDLNKAKIILTESMFKCTKWLKNLAGKDDPMEVYFNGFKAYDHALYVGNTDSNIINANGKIKLGYQFLNTLAITKDKFDSLMSKQEKFIGNTRKRLAQENYVLDEEESEEYKEEKKEVWREALKLNAAFQYDPKIKGIIKDIEMSTIKDCGIGRITVKGACRFISRDLLALLIHIASCCPSHKEQELSSLKSGEKLIRLHSFYMPGAKGLDSTTYYAILRNPHLSRNEQTMLSPYIINENDSENYHNKYLSHLRGVIMVAYKSLVPMALAGADFDGDLVKVVYEPIINDAIKNSVYQTKENNDKKIERKLPIIEIPTIPPKSETVPNNVDYTTVKNTFSSKVGQISNLAIQFGKKEYFECVDDKKYERKCAECTIVTGLEIDAAKTGRHPNLQSLISHQQTLGTDYFLDKKDKITSMPYKKKMCFTPNEQEKEISVSFNNYNQSYLKAKDFASTDKISNIDRLPFWFVSFLKKRETELMPRESIQNEEKNESGKKKKIRFSFEEEKDWKALDEQKLIGLCKVILSYKKTISIASRDAKIRERYEDTKYAACVYNLLHIKYDDIKAFDEPLSWAYDFLETVIRKGAQENNAELKTYSEMIIKMLVDPKQFENTHKKHWYTKDTLDRLIEMGPWYFVEKNKRREYIELLFGIESGFKGRVERMEKDRMEKVYELITDFKYAGYKILYYITKDIMCLISKDESFTDEINIDSDIIDEELFEKLQMIYKDACKNKRTKKVWEGEVIEKCREKLVSSELFGNDENTSDEDRTKQFDEALKYAHALRANADKSGTFFWSVFKNDEILRNVYSAKETGGEANAK